MLNAPRLAAIAAAILACGLPLQGRTQGSQSFIVDCSKGQTISEAIMRGDERKPMVLTVRGSCSEAVTIARDNVTIHGVAGASVQAPSANQTTIAVRGTHVFIDGLRITGGAFGIAVVHVLDVVIDNTIIQNAGQAGINLLAGHARISNSTIQNSGTHGVSLSQSTALVNNNQILSNNGNGVYLQQKSAAQGSGNTITDNGIYGIRLTGGSDAIMNGGTISGNGTNPATSVLFKGGVSIESSTAQFNNTSISNNLGRGLIVNNGGSINSFNNVVNGNAAEGVIFYVGAIGNINGGMISNNAGNGLWLGVNSTAQIGNVSVMNNAQHGIALSQASKLYDFATPLTVSGNAWWGLYCYDSESSAADLSNITFSGNGSGSASCTGY